MIDNIYNWRIHRKLDEARRVYICPARGNCKPERTREMYEDLLNQGKEITFVRAADFPKKDPFKIHEDLLDMDLCSNRESRWLDTVLEKHFEEEMHKYLQKEIEGWKPKIIIDTAVPDDSFLYDWKLWSLGSLYSVGVIAMEENA